MAFPTDNPTWANNDTYIDGVTPNKIRPDAPLRDYGYLPFAEPTAQELNWQLNNLQLQIAELKNIAAGASQTPINELKIIVGDTRNPAVIYGYGSWVAFATGRTLVGVGTGTDTNSVNKSFSAGSSGGDYETKLSASQLPSHAHTYEDAYYFERGPLSGVPSSNKRFVGTSFNGGIGSGDTDQDNDTLVFRNETTGAVGSGQAHDNMMPHIAVNIWRRIA